MGQHDAARSESRDHHRQSVLSKGITFPKNTDFLEELPRKILLTRMADYRHVFAVGRTAIEAKILDCNILAYDPRFPDTDFWQILDNKDAAKILQAKLEEIDE